MMRRLCCAFVNNVSPLNRHANIDDDAYMTQNRFMRHSDVKKSHGKNVYIIHLVKSEIDNYSG